MNQICRVSILGCLALFACTLAQAQTRWDKQHWSCTGKGDQKRVSAQLMDIPRGASWEKTCAAQRTGPYGISKAPDQCINNAGMWGVWYVSSPADCAPKLHWAGEARECTSGWKSTVSARLWGIRPGASWEERCAATDASGPVSSRFGVSGKPDRCAKGALNEGMWGEWDVEDDGNCPDGRFARYPLEVFNKSAKDVWATVMWVNDGKIVTNTPGWIKAGGHAKLSVAGIDCNPAELERRLNSGADGNAWNSAVGSLTMGTRDSCLGEHFQVFFWNSQEAFLGYAAENSAVAIATFLLVDQLIGQVTGGLIPLPGAKEASDFASSKWLQMRDPEGKLQTWGVHGWAHNVPQQKAVVYYWGPNYAQDVVLADADTGTLQHPAERSPRFVHELPVGDSTPTEMQKRFCTSDC